MKDFRNELLKRRELVFVLEEESNPGYEGAKKAVAEKFKADEKLIVVKGVKGSFGSNKFDVEAFIYDSEEAMQKAEPKKKEKGAKK